MRATTAKMSKSSGGTWTQRRLADIEPRIPSRETEANESDAGPTDQPTLPRLALPLVIAEAAITLVVAGTAFVVIDALAPGTDVFRNSSAVGFLSPKTLTVWESIALWAGLAAVIGAVAPFSSRFRGGSSGIPGATALLLVYSPLAFLIAIMSWSAGLSVIRDVRTTLPFVFGSVAIAEWGLSMTRIRVPWGVIHGPESTIWMAVLAGVLIARWSHGDIGLSSDE